MALFQVVDEYSSQGGQGGTCAFCNASKRTTDRPERIITTNLEIDYDAPPGVWPVKWLEMCETCVTEMAHLLNMQTKEEIEGLNHTIGSLLNALEDLEDKLDVVESQLAATDLVKALIPKPVPVVSIAAPTVRK